MPLPILIPIALGLIAGAGAVGATGWYPGKYGILPRLPGAPEPAPQQQAPPQPPPQPLPGPILPAPVPVAPPIGSTLTPIPNQPGYYYVQAPPPQRTAANYLPLIAATGAVAAGGAGLLARQHYRGRKRKLEVQLEEVPWNVIIPTAAATGIAAYGIHKATTGPRRIREPSVTTITRTRGGRRYGYPPHTPQ